MRARGIAPLVLLMLIAPVQPWGCSSRSGAKHPSLSSLELACRLEKGASSRYRATYVISSPLGGKVAPGLNLSITWTQTVRSAGKDGGGSIEATIDDVLFEIEGAPPTPGGITSTIKTTLLGIVYSFDVTASGRTTAFAGPDIEWEKAFKAYFDKEGTAEPLRAFIAGRIQLYFSREQLAATLTLPFRTLPEKPGSIGAWEEKRGVAVMGINADATIRVSPEGFADTDAGTVLVLRTESDQITGSTEMGIPDPDMPVVIEVKITGGTMEGQISVDPGTGMLISGEESYDLAVEARSGLPSLDPQKQIGEDATALTFSMGFKSKIERLH
jgi:hypothetical protein